MKRRLVLAAAFVLVAAAPERPVRDDGDRVQGTWSVVSLVNNGKPAPKGSLKKQQLIFEGTHFALEGGKEEYRGTFRLHPKRSPPWIDTVFHDVDKKEKGRALGIYRLTGNELTIAWNENGKDRPRALESAPGSGVRLIVVRRPKLK
jgi:uncharacterized protein (TIGR03067 family)